MKKHVLILGSSGMLGHVVNKKLRSLNKYFSVTDIARNNNIVKPDIIMDVTDFRSLRNILIQVKPDVIVNCIGVLNKSAEINPGNAILINAYLPHFLEEITANSTCKVIHISTDCVFSGKKGYYTEFDFMDANDYYGRSKALGELRNNKDLTIRTSIIGPELHTSGIGLLGWFFRQSGNITGYSKVFWTGVTSVELSKAIIYSINQDITGLYHLVNNVRMSKYDLLKLFKYNFPCSKVLNVVEDNTFSYDKSLINTRIDFQYQVPAYEEMINNMKLWILEQQGLYPHYLPFI